MPDEKLRPPFSLKRHGSLLFICALAILCFSQAALAQSGRRQSKTASPSPPPPVANEPKVESPATAPTPKPADSPSIIVVGDRIGTSLYLPSTYVDEVVLACVERLGEKPGLEIIQGGHMTRKAATERARKETSAYVLFIEIREESDNSNSLEIGYSVFTPETAKVLTGGWVYPGNRGVGGKVTVGVPTVSRRLPLQYQLRDAGQQVADRVRGKLR